MFTQLEVIVEEKQGRWSSGRRQQKQSMRLLRGESIDSVCRDIAKVTGEALTRPRRFHRAGVPDSKARALKK